MRLLVLAVVAALIGDAFGGNLYINFNKKKENERKEWREKNFKSFRPLFGNRLEPGNKMFNARDPVSDVALISIGIDEVWNKGFNRIESRHYEDLAEDIGKTFKLYLRFKENKEWRERIASIDVKGFGRTFALNEGGTYFESYFVDALIAIYLTQDVSDYAIVKFVEKALQGIRLDHSKGLAYLVSKSLYSTNDVYHRVSPYCVGRCECRACETEGAAD